MSTELVLRLPVEPARITHIYQLRDPETREIRYVGKTCTSLRQRLYEHVYIAKLGRKSTHTSRWIAKLLERDLRPQIEPIDTLPAGVNWQSAERYWISCRRADGCRLTNMTEGGDSGFSHCESVKELLRQKAIGRRHSPEARARMSQERRTRGESYRRNMSLALIGRTFSEESRQKLSQSKRGWSPSAETRRRMSEGQRGRKHPPEVRAKIAEANRLRTRSAESIARSVQRQRAAMFSKIKPKLIAAAAAIADGQTLRSAATLAGISTSTLIRNRKQSTWAEVLEAVAANT